MTALLVVVVVVALALAALGRCATPKPLRRPLLLWLLEDAPSDLEKGAGAVGQFLRTWQEWERRRLRRRQPWLRDEQHSGE